MHLGRLGKGRRLLRERVDQRDGYAHPLLTTLYLRDGAELLEREYRVDSFIVVPA